MQDYSFPALDSSSVVSRSSTAAALAVELVARAESEAAAVREQAAQEGRAAGWKEAIDEAQDGLRLAVETLVSAAERFEDLLAEQATQLEHNAVALALEIAERIVGAALGLRPELVTSVVSGTLRSNGAQGRVAIEVNPADYELIRTMLDATPGATDRIDLTAERRIARGGCIVTSAEGETDGRIDVMLERAGDVVRAAISDQASASDDTPR